MKTILPGPVGDFWLMLYQIDSIVSCYQM